MFVVVKMLTKSGKIKKGDYRINSVTPLLNLWRARRDSNPRPTDSKSGALSS